ncbi:hypothetical protein R3P38DRAFT_3236951 [Favolaschia claudopus]|uniref:Uncharacterized protein n=1 Tax=Favolaschia claudopus TaxID=2862362 RepID=A0AAV9ZBX3_9AGAR
MAFDMNDPAQRAIAHDRLMAGICPTLGPQKSLRKRRHAKAEQLTRDRLAREAIEPPKEGHELIREKRRQVMELYGGMCLRPRKPTLVAIARENLERSLRPKPTKTVKFDLSKTVKIDPPGNLGRRLQEVLPPLPIHAPFRDRLAAFFGEQIAIRSETQAREMKARAYAEQDRARAEGAMIKVAAEILKVGAEKRRLEKDEVGPAPVGLMFVQDGDCVLLARIDGDGPRILFGNADGIRVVTN